MILLSAKHLCCHLNSQSENLPNQHFFYCCRRQSFLETKSHSRINKRWSESSISRGWFAGQEFKFSLSEAACSLLKHYVHPYAAVRQHLCHWGCLPLESWTQAATKSGMAIHGSVSNSAKQLVPSALLGTACCSFSISCKKDAQVLPLSLPTALIQSRKVAFSPPSCNVSSLWVAAVAVEKSLCRDSYEWDGSSNWMCVGAKYAAAVYVDYVLVLLFPPQLCSVKKVQETWCVLERHRAPEPFLSASLISLHCPHTSGRGWPAQSQWPLGCSKLRAEKAIFCLHAELVAQGSVTWQEAERLVFS